MPCISHSNSPKLQRRRWLVWNAKQHRLPTQPLSNRGHRMNMDLASFRIFDDRQNLPGFGSEWMVTTELYVSETVDQYSFETDVSAAWSWATVKFEKEPIHPNRLSRFSRITELSCIVLVQSDVSRLVPCKHGTRERDYCENWLAAKYQSSLCDQTFLRQIMGNHNYLVAAGKIWKNAAVVGSASMTFELVPNDFCEEKRNGSFHEKLSTSRPNGNESYLNHCQRLQGSST